MKNPIFRNNWLSLYIDIRWWNMSVGPASYFDNRWHVSGTLTTWLGLLLLPFFGLNIATGLLLLIPACSIYLDLPIRSKINDSEYPQNGFYFYGADGIGFGKTFLWESFWLRLGMKTKCFYMPWSWDWVRTSVLRVDGHWEHETTAARLGQRDKQFYDKNKWGLIFKYETFPYTYVLKNGQRQEVLATVKTEEREWRWRWFKWASWPSMVRRTISVEFSDEVGERRGSWKGGTLGCGWDMLPGESPEACLRRMEMERKFN